jgi:predicted HAD superfamily phosphohydrolase YqeG
MPKVRALTAEGRREQLAKDFSFFIRRKMREGKVSQAMLAKELDMTQAGVSYAIDKMSLSYRQLVVICDTLHTDTGEVAKYLSTLDEERR